MRFDCSEYPSDRSFNYGRDLQKKKTLSYDDGEDAAQMESIAMIVVLMKRLQQLECEELNVWPGVSLMPGTPLAPTRQVILLWVRRPARTNQPI